MPIKALLIEDNAMEAEMIRDMVTSAKNSLFSLECVGHLSEGLRRLSEEEFQIVLLDLGLPDSQGLDTFLQAHQAIPGVPIIVLSASDDQALAIKAVGSGAQDYLLKGEINSNLLLRAMRYAIERKQSDEALRMLVKAVETMQLGVTITDTSGKILYTNNADAMMHGHDAAELMGADVRLLAPADLWDPMTLEKIKEMKSWQRESINIRKDKTNFPVRLMSDVVTDASGRPIGIITTCEDITERKRVEEALRQSEEKYRTILETIEDGYYEVDLEGNFRFFNKALCRILGYSSSELMGMNNRNYMDEENAKKVYLMVNLVYNTGRPARAIDCEVIRKDGTKRVIELSASVIRHADSSIQGFRGIVRDITERKLAEQFLLERTKAAERTRALERSNKELEQFAYIASHDMQEPLRKIQAFGERLLSKYQEALGEEGRDYLERMQNAARRMQVMISDLLLLSRVTSQTRPFVKLDLNKVVREALSDLEVRLEKTAGVVQVEELPVIDGDPMQMRQLFQNLLSNALKFHRRNEKPDIRIYVNRAGEIVVEDHGIGFDPKDGEIIFQPFFRLHGRTEYEGTGIGLAICRKIVENHSGSIRAEGTLGKGARFVVNL